MRPIGVPFPRKISGPSSPCAPSFSNASSCLSECTDTTRTVAGGEHGPQNKLTPLGSFRASTEFSDSILVRVPSSYSTATDRSTLQRTADPPAKGRTRRTSVLQFLTKSLTWQSPRSLQPLSSASLSPPHDTTADLFTSNTFPAGSNHGPYREPAVAISSQGINLRSDRIRDTASPAVLLKTDQRRKLKATQRSKHNVAHLGRSHFDPKANLTPWDLEFARNLELVDQNGVRLKFGDLWIRQRTCVIFIRHFWCPLCMDYIRSIEEQIHPNVLEKLGVKLVVISNGSSAMIKPYQSMCKFSFPIYTDPSLAIYRALGMTLRTVDGGPKSEQGDYIEHGKASGIAMVMRNAVKARVPIHKYGGDVKQLGGEFVLGPGLHCSYASRMHNTRSHKPIADVLSAAGVDLRPQPDPPIHTFGDEDQWMRERDAELRRIRAKRGRRRGFSTDRSIDSYSESHDGERTERSPWEHGHDLRAFRHESWSYSIEEDGT